MAAIASSLGVFQPAFPNPTIRPPFGPMDWKETRRYSVNRVLIVEGVAPDIERALAIAQAIGRPSTEAYDEMAIYVRTPDRSRTRRVTWTKASGYTLLDF